MKQTDAIVMATPSKLDSDLAGVAPGGRKSMIPLNGRPAVTYLVENLRQCGLVSRVIVVSDEPELDCVGGVDACIPSTGDMSADVLAAVRASTAERCLIMNGDMPLASCEAITDLLTCAPPSDLVYPVVGKADVVEMFPGRPAFYVETKEGHFTGSSCLLFNPQAALAKQDMLSRLLAAKSNPKQLLGLLGPGLAMKLMLTKVALREFEEHLTRILDMDCRVFITHYPEMLVSIDTPGDVQLMERELPGI